MRNFTKKELDFIYEETESRVSSILEEEGNDPHTDSDHAMYLRQDIRAEVMQEMRDKGAFRVLVCGGKDYSDYEKVEAVLDSIHKDCKITTIIQGGASGADSFSKSWALANGVDFLEFPADWAKYGRPAGPIRNSTMLKEGDPHLVVAFPGNRGTRDMRSKAERAGVEVKVID